MKRQVLTDGTGRWFDVAKAELFAEATYWNGRNHISRATGSQWDHEALYRTAGGRWILNSWSRVEGSTESWVEVTPGRAAAWLAENEHEPPDALTAEFAALEIV